MRFNLSKLMNLAGETVTDKWIEIEDSKITLYQVECLSSAEFGLGICRCVNHDPVSLRSYQISALSLLLDGNELILRFKLKPMPDSASYVGIDDDEREQR